MLQKFLVSWCASLAAAWVAATPRVAVSTPQPCDRSEALGRQIEVVEGNAEPDSRRTATLRETVLFEDTFETDTGWIVGAPGDDATLGIWTRNNPQGTYSNEVMAQPEDDHTPDPGVQCWVTDYRRGDGPGSHDVDGGRTTLTSPIIDLSGGDATIGYWRWFSNGAGASPHESEDLFVVDVSNNGGSSWTNVETVGPDGPDTEGGWLYHEFHVSDFVTPTSQIRLRFVAADRFYNSLVEAALDDFKVVRAGNPPLPGDFDGDGDVDLVDFAALPGCLAGPSVGLDPGCAVFDFDNDTDVDAVDFGQFQNVFTGSQ